MPQEDKWLDSTFHYKTAGAWAECKPYTRQAGVWVECSGHVKGVGETTPPPEDGYYMRVGYYRDTSSFRGYDPFVQPPWDDGGDMTPSTMPDGKVIFRFTASSSKVRLKITGGTTGDPGSIIIRFADGSDYPLAQAEPDQWESYDTGLMSRFQAAEMLFDISVADTPPPGGVVEGPPVTISPDSTPITEPLLVGRKDILWFRDFNDKSATEAWFGGRANYDWTGESGESFTGGGGLKLTHPPGQEGPYNINVQLETFTDVAYVRWHRKWDDNHNFHRHKHSGVYAWKDGVRVGGDAGNPGDGYNKFSCKLSMNNNGVPYLYTYNIDQPEGSGEDVYMNIDPDFRFVNDVWYTIEIMIKANTVTNGKANRDGEMSCWVDGRRIGYFNDMRFRHTTALKISEFNYSCYDGGDGGHTQPQYVYDDNICAATGRIDQHLPE